jgi:DNA mismatch endonuclease, patch repair protein
MSKIRGHGNKATELRMIKFLRAHKITGWRRHQSLFGKPDFVFRSCRVAIFVDGCFWHSCPKHSVKPRSNVEFWQKKLTANIVRDKLVTRTLRKAGWQVLRIWEHELNPNNSRRLAARLRRYIFENTDKPTKTLQ